MPHNPNPPLLLQLYSLLSGKLELVCPPWYLPSSLLKAQTRPKACIVASFYPKKLQGCGPACEGPAELSELFLASLLPFSTGTCSLQTADRQTAGCQRARSGWLTLKRLAAIDELAVVWFFMSVSGTLLGLWMLGLTQQGSGKHGIVSRHTP